MVKNKKNIYFVIPTIIPKISGGGAEKVVTILLNHINREKFNVKLILFDRASGYFNNLSSDIEIIDLKKKTRWDFLKLIFRLRGVIKREKPEIVFSALHYANIIVVLSNLFLDSKCKVIISEHSHHREYLPHLRFKAIKKILMFFTYRKAHKIIAVSNGVKQILVSDFSIENDKIEVIYNPIEIKRIRNLSKEVISHPFFADRHNFVIISVGNLTKAKNQGLLIEALASVRKKIPALLVILGEGELKENLRTLAGQLEVEKYVDFVGFQNNPYAWIKRADLFVLSSNWEGFGNVIVEAMACGVPVISTDCPAGPREIITNRKNGLLIPVNDVHSMCKAILEIAENKELSNRLREEAFRDIQKFDFSNIVPKYENIFECIQKNQG